MKIAVWKTGHEIADTVAEAIHDGLRLPVRYGKCRADKFTTEMKYDPNVIEVPDIHIGYGILRGMGDVFRACDKAGKPWFNIDRGYWKPGHFDGYYRVSLCGTQQTIGLDKLEPDYERWDRLGIEIRDALPLQEMGPKLVCPPTDHASAFFDFTPRYWETMNAGNTSDWFYRRKDCERSLKFDLQLCSEVRTFNSSVGWEALRQGIPVISDPTHSIVGAFQKNLDNPLHMDSKSIRRLFALMAGLQLTLEEMRSGQLWPLLSRLISISAGIQGKPSLPMSPPTA